MFGSARSAFWLLLATAAVVGLARGGESGKQERVLTHADAAIILAKHSGFFDRYVDQEAELAECVAFLNKTGIYFGLKEVIDGAEFTVGDCARALGQLDLVFGGEAEFYLGKVKLPKGIESWEEFCTMHGVNHVERHRVMVRILQVANARNK